MPRNSRCSDSTTCTTSSVSPGSRLRIVAVMARLGKAVRALQHAALLSRLMRLPEVPPNSDVAADEVLGRYAPLEPRS